MGTRPKPFEQQQYWSNWVGKGYFLEQENSIFDFILLFFRAHLDLKPKPPNLQFTPWSFPLMPSAKNWSRSRVWGRFWAIFCRKFRVVLHSLGSPLSLRNLARTLRNIEEKVTACTPVKNSAVVIKEPWMVLSIIIHNSGMTTFQVMASMWQRYWIISALKSWAPSLSLECTESSAGEPTSPWSRKWAVSTQRHTCLWWKILKPIDMSVAHYTHARSWQ